MNDRLPSGGPGSARQGWWQGRNEREASRVEMQALKGFKDILPVESGTWQAMEARAREVLARHGCAEIRVPLLEKTELFARSIGQATDIVEKEMYSFTDRNGESVTLRPEGTASVLRAFVEHGLHTVQAVQRLYTLGPMFRHERPQKGRLRQFHQLSVEVIGSASPYVDAEVMAMAWSVLAANGVAASLEINSLGCPGCRPAYRELLLTFLNDLAAELCPDCQRRRSTNPLRVMDCKSSHCQERYQGLPKMKDHLCGACQEHFVRVQGSLQALGIPYAVNPAMVRGLDYYVRTAFELVTDQLGAQAAVGAGGRYDGLIAALGGPDLPAIGFAIGLERLALLVEQAAAAAVSPPALDLFLVGLGQEATGRLMALAHAARGLGLRVGQDFEGRSLKAQLKLADRLGARWVLVLGDNELRQGQALMKEMASGRQQPLPVAPAPRAWAEALMPLCQPSSTTPGPI
ncbi:MAG: histidine--tRNA ligase [Thermodesulfobacteriota bacterium]